MPPSSDDVTVNALSPPIMLVGSLRQPPFTSNVIPSSKMNGNVPVKSLVTPGAVVKSVSTNADGETSFVSSAAYSALVENRTCMSPVTPPVHASPMVAEYSPPPSR